MTASDKPLDKKTVPELKADLKALGLPQTGVKAELIARIQAATQSGNSEAADTEAAVTESAPEAITAEAEVAEPEPTAEVHTASVEAPTESAPSAQTESAIVDPVASEGVNGEVSFRGVGCAFSPCVHLLLTTSQRHLSHW